MTHRRFTMTMGNLAIAVILFTTDTARGQQGSDSQETPPPQSQQPTVRPEQPIAGGRHLQPEGQDLQDRGVPAPSRQDVEEMDRLMQQLLEQSGNGPDKATRQ